MRKEKVLCPTRATLWRLRDLREPAPIGSGEFGVWFQGPSHLCSSILPPEYACCFLPATSLIHNSFLFHSLIDPSFKELLERQVETEACLYRALSKTEYSHILYFAERKSVCRSQYSVLPIMPPIPRLWILLPHSIHTISDHLKHFFWPSWLNTFMNTQIPLLCPVQILQSLIPGPLSSSLCKWLASVFSYLWPVVISHWHSILYFNFWPLCSQLSIASAQRCLKEAHQASLRDWEQQENDTKCSNAHTYTSKQTHNPNPHIVNHFY